MELESSLTLTRSFGAAKLSTGSSGTATRLGAPSSNNGGVVTPDSRTVRSRLEDSPRGIARYLSGRMWDPLVRSSFFLISSRTERR